MENKEDRSLRNNRSYIFDYASTIASTGLIQVIGVITGIMTARLLGPAGKGELTMVLWLPGFMTVAAILALPQAVAFQVSRNQGNDTTLTAVGFWLSLLWGLFLAVVLYPFIPYILGSEKQYLVDTSRWFLLYLPVAFSGLTLLGVDQGRQAFTRFNLLRLLPAIFFVIGLVILWLMRRANLTTIVLSNLLAQVLATWIRVAVAGRVLFIDSFFNWITTAQQLLKKGIIFHLPALAGIILLRTDIALLIHMVSAQEIGYYSVAMAVSMGQIGVVTSIVQVSFPKLSKYESADALPVLLRQFRLAQPLVLSAALIVTLFSPWIIRYLFGTQFLPAVRPAFILIMAIAVWGLNQILDNGLRAMGYGLPGTMANGIGLAALISIGIILTHLYRIPGMSISVFISQLVAFLILLMIVRKKMERFSWKDIYGLNRRTFNEIRYALKRKI